MPELRVPLPDLPDLPDPPDPPDLPDLPDLPLGCGPRPFYRGLVGHNPAS